jgi:lysophospholipase L1-like esterase
LADLSDVKDSILEGCQRAGAKNFKVFNPNNLLGMSGSMEEDEVARIMGDDPVHLSEGGYVLLAEKLLLLLIYLLALE